jgi:ABC-type Mn2+/Zn2+ transport system permease subunit
VRSTPVAAGVTLTQPLALAAYLAICGLAGWAALEHLTRPATSGQARDWATPLVTIAAAIACNASCAILGCYLVLRRMSLLGDAISHAVLPGIAIGFLISGSLTSPWIFVGALGLGMLTSVLAQGVSSLGRVSEDASLGVVFTSLFALGVILINLAPSADLDPDCVLYGDIVNASLDLRSIGGWQISRPFLTLVPVLIVTLLFVALLWKELKIVSFDPALAAAMGFYVGLVHYLLMGMVSVVTVASFESVGSVLVVAVLIVPAATAALITERLGWMIAWAVAIGATSAVFGYIAAMWLNTSVAGATAVVAGLQFTAAVFASPKQGLISRWLRNQALAVRIAAEDVIGRLYRAEERVQSLGLRVQEESGVRSQESGVSGFVGWLANWRLFRRGWVVRDPACGLRLTTAGRDAARRLVRAHRLWESYLDTHFDLPRDHLHEAAERMEHYLDPQLQDDLAAELAGRAVDPHGKEIPAP